MSPHSLLSMFFYTKAPRSCTDGMLCKDGEVKTCLQGECREDNTCLNIKSK
jgi:hypothetical protein